jgi:membrane-bound lytic murein transglycosylase MltF
MKLEEKQLDVKTKIDALTEMLGLPSSWPASIAMTESSLGLNQKSPTGCVGVFQLSSIAMKDLQLEMRKHDDEWIDILCGIAFLHLLYKRFNGDIATATEHFCDPNDRDFYTNRMLHYRDELEVMK